MRSPGPRTLVLALDDKTLPAARHSKPLVHLLAVADHPSGVALAQGDRQVGVRPGPADASVRAGWAAHPTQEGGRDGHADGVAVSGHGRGRAGVVNAAGPAEAATDQGS